MKRILTFVVLITLTTTTLYADIWKVRLVENDYGYLELQMRCTDAGETPVQDDPISGMTFQIYWPTSYGADIALICTSNPYNIADGLSARQTTGASHWREWYIAGAPIACPTTWTTNEWETITSWKVTGGSGTGTFTLANDLELGAGLNFQWGTPIAYTYHPDVEDGPVTNYAYPTKVYTHVWEGGATDNGFQNEYSWNRAENWKTECGSAGTVPTSSSNCFIPSGKTYYPQNYNKAFVSGTAPANHVRIQNGASINFLNAMDDEFDVSGDLLVEGTLTVNETGHTNPGITVTGSTTVADGGSIVINENAEATFNGSTTINAANGILVKASSTGSGSFIDNGTINYGGSGSAKVQTYITNNSLDGSFCMHFIGPTVSGATLSDFNVADSSTYVYEWEEDQIPDEGWNNLYLLTDVIDPAKGIGFSTTDNTTHTLEMTGNLSTGNVTNSLTYSNNHLELISNPYPSSVDFDALATTTANANVVLNKYWIYDPIASVYVARAGGSGGSQYVQVGQGMFVETKAAGDFTFTNTERSHSNDPFRNTIVNELTVFATGGQEGYKDELVVRFEETATSGYDIELEAIKWNSQVEDATMIRSIAEDETELAINFLPLEGLFLNMVSVPVHFNCGYNTNYSLSFEGMETFESGTDIYLEDKKEGGEWIYVKDQPEYNFTASPDEPVDRFVIHFFGPDGIVESAQPKPVDIYGHGYHAYVKNNSDEQIKKVQIYTLSGVLVKEINDVRNKISKYWVDDDTGYFVVKVITNKNVYTGKILIGIK